MAQIVCACLVFLTVVFMRDEVLPDKENEHDGEGEDDER